MFTDLKNEKKKSKIWHPFAQPGLDHEPIHIVRGEGAYLYTESGTAYLDAISSWWCNLHGHAHPYIAQKISEQAYQLEHVIFSNITHSPAEELSQRLTELLPDGLERCFFSDNGACSIEIALKITLQYFYNQGRPKTRFVSLKHGYHGDTFGAMSIAGPADINQPFQSLFFPVDTIDPPYYGKEDISLQQAQALFSTGEIAGFIYEPILQGTGGMRVHNPEGLDAILALAKHYDVFCIADEILTGFGRTRPLFASEYMQTNPDILCLSKGLTGGFLPLAVTVVREEIYQAFVAKDRRLSFLHGHTYTGNPLGCAAALASLDLTLSPQCKQQREMIETCHKQFQSQYGSQWQRCDVLGTVLAVDYPTKSLGYFSNLRDTLYNFFIDNHLILRPLGNTIYVLPPYCIHEEDLQRIYHYLQEILCLRVQ
ncbi:adenosylmethionine--8-amino-7-oxononanoate transaminase [Chlamydia psittaci]|uniref:adenosylmethionine--8-amino-7-oxononanoate transaminase n=1 Tax=Chlamydia psittaci TaxID=83554 RepID=UPI00027E18C4|nr:adenosylmethionine--8-amino-7-oxononanoate transaminase [Chlamydia psittaci]AFS21247.1 adenosylmethionine-8-amino-7-oxononanoate transaminase [Chlamydia psittaci MN]KPZ38789.1 adenosylmethionine-8-amino-7-oxononanoate aminotransferase [Chlamydia psittaci str. Frances]MBE3636157.1 adenosylmethionine--8-amino-7-oxononanoate transaminase [Chlamydia psittaci]CCO02207.1 putative adenosylmethionine-8-amino-7-oxononanoate aminotransferase [Chlamydia psittaci 01DC12]BEU44385.1 adenosylmethionine--8